MPTIDLLRRHVLTSLVVVFGPILALGLPKARAGLPQVPEGFTCRLVASVPAIEYPCQVATAPGGWLFVAEDPMDQVGPYEADHGRILLFRDGQDPVVFAEGLRAVFGMAWHNGALYVMHMPYLSIFRDADGDGRAEHREDLFKDLGPGPKPGALNDHIVSGLQFGMDGWLYISVGDKGVPGATRPEDGVVVQLKGGGTLRCRPDGTQLEVYSSGTRNHLAPNLDELDNLFTYDNTDDGDGWWTRVTHQIDGGYYGYPYDYHDRPDRFLPQMAEYGGGSPCGGLFYKEDAWPEKYQGMGFWAEWGKGKVQAFRFAPKGASFEVVEQIDFVIPEKGDSFRPIDLALSDDGQTLYIADWNMGGWGNKTEKVGRVFAVSPKEAPENLRPRGSDADSIEDQIAQLDHPAFSERMRAQQALITRGEEALGEVHAALFDESRPVLARRHLVWVLDGIAGATPEATLPLVDLLKSPEAELRAQAARALGQRNIPLALATEALVDLLEDPEPKVQLQALIALGRAGDLRNVPAILPSLASPDVFLAWSARVALQRIGDWDSVAEGFESEEAAVRIGALQVLEQQYHPKAVAHLIAFAFDGERPADERARALQFAAEVVRKAKPWDGSWWGTRPTQGKPPARVLDWEETGAITEAVRRGLLDSEPAVRLAAVAAVRWNEDREALATLVERFAIEEDSEVRVALAQTFGAMEYGAAVPSLIEALRDPDSPENVREAALNGLAEIGTGEAIGAMVALLDRDELADDRRVRLIEALGKLRARSAVPGLLDDLKRSESPVWIAAIRALGQIGQLEQVAPRLRSLLDDESLEVRKAAIEALARLGDREAVAPLLKLAGQEETRFEASMALTRIADLRALQIYLHGLTDKSPDLRQGSAEALKVIREEAATILDQLADRHELPTSALPELRKIYTTIHPIPEWRILGPLEFNAQPLIDPEGSIDLNAPEKGLDDRPLTWDLIKAVDDRGQINLGRAIGGSNRSVFGYAEVESPIDRPAQMVVGSDDTLTVWLNGEEVYRFDRIRAFKHDQGRVEVELRAGINRLVIHCGNDAGDWKFAVGLSRQTEHAFLAGPTTDGFDPEAFRDFALKQEGDPENGHVLFHDPKGLACSKCHQVDGQGGTVGPDLTGIGAKYAAEEIIESVLYPSAKIFSGYEPIIVATNDGQVLTGIIKSEDDQTLVIQDADDQTITIPKGEIEEQRLSNVSLMPSGLAEGLSQQDFADLIAYLQALQDAPAEAPEEP